MMATFVFEVSDIRQPACGTWLVLYRAI